MGEMINFTLYMFSYNKEEVVFRTHWKTLVVVGAQEGGLGGLCLVTKDQALGDWTEAPLGKLITSSNFPRVS